MKNKQDIINKYKDKVLAIESYGGNNKIYYDKFIQADDLLHHLYELNCHEISLTDDGLNLIKDYYGLDKVIQMIIQEIKNGVDYKYNTRDDIMEWLKLKGNIKTDTVIGNDVNNNH